MDRYHNVLQELYARQTRRGMKLGVERVRALLDAVGAPDVHLKSVLVAGTNGKGSTCAFARTLFAAAGERVGLYTSPHLSRFTERIQVDGVEIAQPDVVALHARVLTAAQGLGMEPTFFELTTVMALRHFADVGVQRAVLEVGMGGRLDATNAARVVACAITPVDLDHMAYLGNTLPEIAAEKAGIIRPGVPVVVAPQDKAAWDVIAAVAAEKGAPLRAVTAGEGVTGALGLAGEHQRVNAAVALALVEAAGVVLTAQHKEHALASTRWPGRLERVTARGTNWMLDGAHNPHGARALGRALAQDATRFGAWVVAASGDRDVGALVAAAREGGAVVPPLVVATQPRVGTAVPAAVTAARLRAAGVVQVEAVSDVDVALTRAAEDGPVVVWGSLYMLGEARARLLGEGLDDVALSG